MSLNGHQVGVFVDRYTGWPGVFCDVTKFLARLCEDYGVPVSCTLDGGVLQLVFLACPKKQRKQMKENWPVVGRVLSMKYL